MYNDLKKLFAKCSPVVKKIIIVVIVGFALFMVAFSVKNGYEVISTNLSLDAQVADFQKNYEAVADGMAEFDRFEDKLSENDPFADAVEYDSDDALSHTYRIEFLDVGAADCTVLTNGNDTFVIDTGDVEDGKYIVDHLQSNGIGTVSVMLTNGAADRVGGFEAFVSELNVSELIVSENAADAQLIAAVELAEQNGVAVRKVTANDQWKVGEATIKVLSAEANIITKIELQATSFLLMSDASLEEEAALYDSGADIEAAVLKVADNGATYSDLHFVRKVNPESVVVSCDAESADRSFLNEVRDLSTVFKTDKFGTIFFLTNGVSHKVYTDSAINCDG